MVRLVRFLSTINRPDPGWFVTLTYRHWIDDFKLWKRHLNRFLTSLRWRYASSTGVWRLEFQSRGAPHFHLLLWLGREEARLTLNSWARDRWLATIEDSSAASREHAVTAEEIRDFSNCGFYLSLYQTKDKQDRKDIQTGREWGGNTAEAPMHRAHPRSPIDLRSGPPAPSDPSPRPSRPQSVHVPPQLLLALARHRRARFFNVLALSRASAAARLAHVIRGCP